MLELQPEARHKVYSNRSLAYAKAGRFQEALLDAQAVVNLSPSWAKGHWRMGIAYVGMKQLPLAVQSFATCWQLEQGDVYNALY